MKERMFLREGLLCDISGKKRKEYYVFMFNDFLIKTSPKHRLPFSNLGKLSLHPVSQKPTQYIYKDIIPFSQVYLASPEDGTPFCCLESEVDRTAHVLVPPQTERTVSTCLSSSSNAIPYPIRHHACRPSPVRQSMNGNRG